ILYVNKPGQITMRHANVLLSALEHNMLVDASIDVFESTWLPAHFAREREEVRTQHTTSHASSTPPNTVEHSLVGRISQNMLRRCIQLVRSAQHGGLVLICDRTEGALRALRLKYRFEPDAATQQYRAILLRLLDAVAESTQKESIDYAD